MAIALYIAADMSKLFNIRYCGAGKRGPIVYGCSVDIVQTGCKRDSHRIYRELWFQRVKRRSKVAHMFAQVRRRNRR